VPVPQQSRAIATRERLLDATAACLCELGLAGASTAAIAARAGVSQGAVFKHFPTKTELLARAVERILAGMVRDFRGAIDDAIDDAHGDRVHAGCAVLWRIFRAPEMRAVFEVYVAARTELDLGARLTPILDAHRASILAEARRLFPLTAAADQDVDEAIDAVVYAMQGAALGLFSPDAADEGPHLAFLERLAHRELARVARLAAGAA
jgi:AcrR family transcriptional regulator